MKTKLVCIVAVFFTMASVSSAYAEKLKQDKDIASYLPAESELKQGWKSVSSYQTAEGMGLFTLVNGGAELYIKNGFRRVVMLGYKNRNKKRISLEIFEMTKPAGAKKIYKHKAADKGKNVGIGDDSLMADYYLIFRKDRFYVTLTGFDSEKETTEGLMIIGKAVEKKLQISR